MAVGAEFGQMEGVLFEEHSGDNGQHIGGGGSALHRFSDQIRHFDDG